MKSRYAPRDNVSELGFGIYDRHYRRAGWLILAGIVALNLVGVLVVALVANGATTRTHINTHAHSPWRFPASIPKLTRYKLIARHDLWVLRTHHPPRLMAYHHRELAHARAHIRRLTAPRYVLPGWYLALVQCESSGNWDYNDGLYEGGINFLNSTWLTYGGGQYAAHAYNASPWEQYLVTLRMHADVPWSQSNPACSAQLGL